MQLDLLIDEVEKAEEPSRDLWLRAQETVFRGRAGVHDSLFRQKIECGGWLDAALDLLPEGVCPTVGQNVHHFYWHAYARIIRDGEPVTVAEGHSNHDRALAALSMALRAHRGE